MSSSVGKASGYFMLRSTTILYRKTYTTYSKTSKEARTLTDKLVKWWQRSWNGYYKYPLDNWLKTNIFSLTEILNQFEDEESKILLIFSRTLLISKSLYPLPLLTQCPTMNKICHSREQYNLKKRRGNKPSCCLGT